MKGNRNGLYRFDINPYLSFEGSSVKMKTPFFMKGVFSQQYFKKIR